MQASGSPEDTESCVFETEHLIMQLRLLVNCPSGESRLLQMEDSVSVFELKQTLQEAEGACEISRFETLQFLDYPKVH